MIQLPISRRSAVLGALSTLAMACRSSSGAAPQSEKRRQQPETEAADLEFVIRGDLRQTDRGGNALVMLHGFGASGDDLLGLADELQHANTRYIVCAAPLQVGNGGRAWWPLRNRPQYDENQVLSTPEPELANARNAVLKLLAKLQQNYAPKSVALLGFSQGAMLALDVALTASGVSRVAVLSGSLIPDTVAQLARASHPTPAVFVSHGRQDNVLPFQAATALVSTLQARALTPEFHAFDGGHQIPGEILAPLRRFLFETG